MPGEALVLTHTRHTYMPTTESKKRRSDFDLVRCLRLMLLLTLTTSRRIVLTIASCSRCFVQNTNLVGSRFSVTATMTQTHNKVRWQMETEDHEWWSSKEWNVCRWFGSCTLWQSDAIAVRWFFIRIPRNLNYVFMAIKMKYYKFNNRMSSTIWSFSFSLTHISLLLVLGLFLCCRNHHETHRLHTHTPFL